MNQMTVKELEVQGCRTFVCPNLCLIEEKGKELHLMDETIKRAKDMAVEYFKKTYREPHYSSARHLLPSFVYLASIFEGERRFQIDVAAVFCTTNVTIKKWNRDILDTLGMEMTGSRIVMSGKVKKKYSSKHIRKILREKILREFECPDLSMIGEKGKILHLNDNTIKVAKALAFRYFKATYQNPHYSSARSLFPAFLYLAGIIENDKRRQLDISVALNVSEPSISIWYTDILDVLGMKIIYGEDKKVLKVLQSQLPPSGCGKCKVDK